MELPQRPLTAALKVICGSRLRLLTAQGLQVSFVRVLPSTSELFCDGQRPGTLLGALPGLSPAALAAHAGALTSAQMRCGLRLVLKSYELDCIAPTEELAREWVRGINHLPLGGKHRHLLMLARKHAAAPEAPTTVARGSTLVHAQPPLPPPPQSLQLEAMGMAEEDDPSVAEAEARRKKRHSEAVFARPVASLDELLDD